MLKVLLNQSMRKLKQWLHFNNLYGNYHFTLIVIILFFLFVNNYNILFLLLMILILVYIFIKSKMLFKFSIICLSIIGSLYFFKLMNYNNANLNINKKLIVISVEKNDTYNKIILKDIFYKYIYYVHGNVRKVDIARVPYGFNYNKFLKYQDTLGILEINDIEYINRVFIFNNINDLLSKYYDNHFKYSDIIKALVIGVKSGIEDELYKSIQSVGISHLFVVSGLHVGILTGILEFVFKKIKMPKSEIFIYLFLGLYLVVTNFMVSVIRVSLGYFIKNTFTKDLTSFDKIVINIIIVLILNPFYAFSYSFILTYLISGMIIIINPILLKRKGIMYYIINTIIISVSSLVITLPIVVHINSDINILSIIYNIFYIPFVSYIVLPLSIIISFLPCLENIFGFIYSFFIISIEFFGDIKLLTLSIPVLNEFGIVSYYILLGIIIYMLEHRLWYGALIFVVFISLWYNKAYFEICDKITFLDVSEGDATHIKKAFNKINIIVDTGIDSDNSIVSYLKKQGIRTIDLIIISHGDSDHNGNLDVLLKEFNVKMIILSVYDNVTYEILKNNNFNNYYLVKRGDQFSIDNIHFDVLWPDYNMNDINNNSIVFKMLFNNRSYLFTGDIEKKAEEELIELEKEIKVDYLKIAHHGSNTSTKSKWLSNVTFESAFVMTGSKNTYGFPNAYTVERLKNYPVYYTSEHYSITLYNYFFSKKQHYKFQKGT